MNDNIVNDEADILLYGLRTARQKKRMQYKGFHRELLRLNREERKLDKQVWELGWIDLHPPVMRGWKRYFVLRDDVARSKEATFFQGILDKINTLDYCTRKDFKIKYRYKGKKQHSVKPQRLKYLGEVTDKKINFSEKERGYFEECEITDWTGKKFIKVFVFTEQWRFVLRIRPNLITKTKVRDEVIESRIAEIENRIERNYWRATIAKAKGESYTHGWWRDEDLQKDNYCFKNMSVSKILDAIKED